MIARTMNKGNKQVTKAVAQKRMTEKAFRAEKAARTWDQHPLFEGKLSGLTEDERQQILKDKNFNEQEAAKPYLEAIRKRMKK